MRSVCIGMVLLGGLKMVGADVVPPDSPVTIALRRAEEAIAKIVAIPDEQRTFENTLIPIDDFIVRLRLETELVQFMNYVSPDAAMREIGRQAEEDMRNWYTHLKTREDLYKAVKACADKLNGGPGLKGEGKRFFEHTLRDYRRAGMELPAEQRAEVKRLELELNKLTLDFEKTIREDETILPCRAEELKGVPEVTLKSIPRSGDMYLVGMDSPTYTAVMTYCEVEPTRQKAFIEYKRRGGKRNVATLEKMLVLRSKIATLLGYKTPAEYECEIRMSKNPEAVRKFYAEVRPLIRKKAQLDFDEFTKAKREHTKDPAAMLQGWDQMFYENHLLKTQYKVDSEKVQEYFPLEAVIQGLFACVSKMYSLDIRDVTERAESMLLPTWHKDVKLYEVWDTTGPEKLGEFFLDPYPREGKYNHFACFSLYPRKIWPDRTARKPVVALVCNFPPPVEGQPALMKHEDVETFFHEFGHCLHGLLTMNWMGAYSGTAVALDFVEAPSQMFENWVWNKEVLKTFARHYKTGEPLPDELIEAMIKAKNVGSGLRAERQVYYGMVDLAYHTAANGIADTTKLGLELMKECELFPPVEQTWFQAGFGHLSHYQSGYYSYLWSQVYAQDMFTPFKEKGLLNNDAGMYYRNHVLSRGGTMDELEMIKGYLGREPKMEPFLEYLGLK